MLHSALTAAIQKNGSSNTTEKLSVDTKSLVAEGSFPCLSQDTGELEDSDEMFEEVREIPVVGTAPIDYTLRDGTPAVRVLHP